MTRKSKRVVVTGNTGTSTPTKVMVDDRYWMIVGGWWWGRGESLEEAIKEATRNAGSEVTDNETRRFIYKVDPSTYIDEFGAIASPRDADEPEKIAELPVGVKVNLNTLAKILV